VKCPVLADLSKYPFLRPALDQPFDLWDVPNRPDEGSYRLHLTGSKRNTNPLQLRTLELDSIVGISFFCSFRSIYGIYAHENPHSSSFEAFNALGISHSDTVFVRYFPLNRGQETITQIWVVEHRGMMNGPSLTLTVRAKQLIYYWPFGSDTIQICTTKRVQSFGLNSDHFDRDHILIACAPVRTLLYNAPPIGSPISVFGAISPTLNMEQNPRPPQIPRSMPSLMRLFSQASLEHVKQVEICIELNPDQKCIGMLFTYQDGTAEALGQRRVGFPGVQMVLVDEPLQLHYSNPHFLDRQADQNLRICFSTSETDESLEMRMGWNTREMRGSVWWAFGLGFNHLEFCD
jgi:hypothetical protein